jgi:oligopeptidase B
MRAVDSPELRAHLDAERAWYESATGHLSSLIEDLRSEMTRRVPATDRSVSWSRRGSSYYTTLPAEREYEQLFRDLNNEGAEQLLLDANLLADASGYLGLGLTMVSPDGRLLAYSVDRAGDEVYRLHFRDLETGADLADEVPHTYYGGAWSAASDQFLYTVHDHTYRPHQVWRHVLGTPVAEDVLVLEEPDQRFELNLRPTRRGDLAVLWSSSRDASEAWVVDTRQATPQARSAGGRRTGVEYHVEPARLDGSDVLLVVTNDGATEFRLAVAPVPDDGDLDHRSWSDVRPEDPTERLERVDAFVGHAVLSFRSRGRHLLRLLPLDGLASAAGVVVEPLLEAGTVSLGTNLDHDTTTVTVVDRSYVHPTVWSDVDLDTGRRSVRHRQEAPGHDPERYVSETRTFASPDGTPVPVTLVRRLRVHVRAGVGPGPSLAARSRRRVRARARPRRRRDGPPLVARGTPRAQAEHLHRPSGGRRRPG